MICISVAADNLEDMLSKLSEAQKQTDLVEIRLDSLWPGLKNKLVSKLEFILVPLKVRSIITMRSVAQGGYFDGDRAILKTILQKALDLGASYLDLEFGSEALIDFAEHREKLICSWHDFRSTPTLDQLQTLAEKMALQAGMLKSVTTVRDLDDEIILYNLSKYLKQKSFSFTVFGMGEQGRNTRLLAPVLGSALSYACLDENCQTAPGQMTLAKMQALWGRAEVSPETTICAGFGSPLGHSAGPHYHEQAYAKKDLNAVYLLFETNSAKQAVELIRVLEIKQASITAPLKEEILPLLDELDEEAAYLSAVNTLIQKEGNLKGYNTDLFGFQTLLKKNKIDLKEKKVLLLGAGGAAQVVAKVVAEAEAGSFAILNRSQKKAQMLAEKYAANFGKLENLKEYQFDVLIDATSVGLDSKSELSAPWMKEDVEFNPEQVVISLVYEPAESYLLQKAKKAGAKAINGWDMFCAQADKQIELWQ